MSDSKSGVSRRKFLGTIGAASVALPFLSAQRKSDLRLSKMRGGDQRNVIFILSDDHRYDFMGFMNTPEFLETPAMDRMASEGAHLENAFVSTALCSPSRASVLTGQYAHTHGVVDNNSLVPEDTIFFPQYLQEIGYQTAFFGKWHMGSSSDEPRKGFDKWVSFRGQGVYFDPTLNVDGERVEEDGHISDILTDYALRWMEEERDPDKPFFLFLSHKAVHARFMPPERYQGKYEDVEVNYPASMANTEQNYRNKPAWVERQRDSWHGVDYMYHGDLDFDTFYKRYCETVLSIDDSIGRVLDHLDDTNLAEETLTMYMGDNGFLFGEHGLIDKRCMYEPSIRVPMLAYAPGMIEPGTVISEQVMNIDIAPTVLEMSGLEAPDHMHGQSFVPLLQGKSVDWRDEIFYEYYWEWNFPQTPTVFGVRTDRYKYMFYHGIWDIAELYDIQNDPDEMHNLIHVPEHADLIEDLNQRMWNWLEETGGMNLPLRPNRGSQQGLELKY